MSEIENRFAADIGGGRLKWTCNNVETIGSNAALPRKNMGDLSGFLASIREKGIRKPVAVRRAGNKYQIFE